MNESSLQVVLPMPETEFLSKRGPLPVHPEDMRHTQRLYFRTKATLRMLSTLPTIRRQEVECIVYTRDISRGGIGFLLHEQLFPCEQVALDLPQFGNVVVTVTSCRYIGPACFEIGASFTSTSE